MFFVHLRQTEGDVDYETMSKNVVNQTLRELYMSTRKQNGELYTRSALTSIRVGLHRHIQLTSGYDIGLVGDPDFAEANKLFQAYKVELKRRSKGQVHVMFIALRT